MKKPLIPITKPTLNNQEIIEIEKVLKSGWITQGPKVRFFEDAFAKFTGAKFAVAVSNCTTGLHLALKALGVQEGDEVITVSHSYIATANSIRYCGAIPVFVDVDCSTFNIDPDSVELAISSKTKAIVVVHYAGISCDMDRIMALAKKYDIPVIEDAAQALLSTYKGKSLGSFGLLASVSFHETKNIISGEGGALIINNARLSLRAEIIREKGTNRSSFFRGEVDKYTWVDLGSSFLPGELTAAFLCAQLEEAENITQRRLEIWNAYHHAFAALEADNCLRRQLVPDFCQHNAHMYYLILLLYLLLL